MLLDNFVCNVKILTVLKLVWKHSDADAAPRKFHALSFRTTGNACYQTKDGTISVDDNDILYVPENFGYHIKAEAEELYVIHFELKEKEQDFLEVFHLENPAKAQKLFADCYDVWNKKEPGYHFKALSIFYHILELMTVSTHSALNDENFQKLQPAIRYLRAHFTEPDLSVLSLCREAHLSDTWFRKLFMKCYGTTPVKYINSLRISYAKELLESGYYTIETVAEMSGFEDAKYFSTTFKQYTGHSPSKHR